MQHTPDLLRAPAPAATMMERAYRVLKRAIIELERPPESRFTEQEVARALGLSKTPVREALARLHRDGLVTPLPRAGYVVAPVTLADVTELCDMRTLLQSDAAARCAARGLDPATADRLDALAIDDRGDLDAEGRLRANYEFEAIIANGSGSARLAGAVVTVLDELERVARLVARLTPALPPGRTRQRVTLTAAVLGGDADAARQAMHARCSSSRTEIVDALLASPAVTGAPILLPAP